MPGLRSRLTFSSTNHLNSHIRCRYCTPLQRSLSSRTFATSAPLLKKSKSKQNSNGASQSGKPRIKWFQQLNPWSTERSPIDPEIGLASGEQYEEAKWLKDQIAKDDADIREMETGGGKTMIEPLLATLPIEDAKKIREAIRKSDLEDERKEKAVEAMEQQLAKLSPKKHELEIKWQLLREQNAYLKALNENILKQSEDPSNQELGRKLWQSYRRCKAFLPPFLHLISDKAWNTIWTSQESVIPDDSLWALHIITLSEDMVSAGRRLDVYQRILYIEALQSQTRQEDAIAEWQKLANNLGDDKRASEEHELLGVRLFASQGDPGKAEKIALNFLGKDKQEESRILIPIMRAWIQRNDDIGLRHAWALYLRFRTHAGNNLTMDDYDNITRGFLEVGRTDIALAIFKDMMLTGQKTDQGSLEVYQKSLGIMGRLQESAITVENINQVSLTGLTTLPRRFQNKYFYGSWLKKLIGAGEVDAAAQVVELMCERGVKPDSKHLNGIIGAWLRAGTDKAMADAEKMAWAMIHKRLDFVATRHQVSKTDSSEPSIASNLPIPKHLRRSVAPATIETFSLLLQHYGRRAQDSNVQLIRLSLTKAQIPPNTYFINHLLYIDLRRGQHQAAWRKYETMFTTLKPDLETYACLWDCEKAHLDSLLLHTHDRFPGPRRIMSDMMNWYASMATKPHDRDLVRDEFSRELYDQTIRCLGISSDLEGTIVALYALREYFDLYPNDVTSRMITLSVSRLKLPAEKSRLNKTRPTRHAVGRLERKANANRIAQAFALVEQERDEVLAEHGFREMMEFDEYFQNEEALWRLVEFLKTVLSRTSEDPEKIEDDIQKAAWEMGVGGVKMMEDPIGTYGERKEGYRLTD